MPAFPVHGWMPDGYRNMPLPVLAVFSAVLSKVAAYGFLRVVIPLFPDASAHFQDLMLVLALGSILYGSAMAFTTSETRLVLGYSSIAQLGFITLGIFALNGDGAQGAHPAGRQPRPGRRPRVRDRRLPRRAHRRLGGHPRHGRHRVPRARARRAVLDRRAREPGDAGLLELRRRVPDPARRLPLQAGHRDHRLHRRRDGRGLLAAALHQDDAQPRRRRRRPRATSTSARASCSCRWSR